MKVDLPTPGTPVMPSRTDLPVRGSSAPSSASARSRWSTRVDLDQGDGLGKRAAVAGQQWLEQRVDRRFSRPAARRHPNPSRGHDPCRLERAATGASKACDRRFQHRTHAASDPAEPQDRRPYPSPPPRERPADQPAQDVEHAEGGVGARDVAAAEALAEQRQPDRIDRKRQARPTAPITAMIASDCAGTNDSSDDQQGAGQGAAAPARRDGRNDRPSSRSAIAAPRCR